MSAPESSVRVSRETLAELERLKEPVHTRGADETIRKLVRERRARALDRMFASGKDVVAKFADEDRLAAHP